jgi:hypothetical protein
MAGMLKDGGKSVQFPVFGENKIGKKIPFCFKRLKTCCYIGMKFKSKFFNLRYARCQVKGEIVDVNRKEMIGQILFTLKLTRIPQLDRGIRQKNRAFFLHKKVCP